MCHFKLTVNPLEKAPSRIAFRTASSGCNRLVEHKCMCNLPYEEHVADLDYDKVSKQQVRLRCKARNAMVKKVLPTFGWSSLMLSVRQCGPDLPVSGPIASDSSNLASKTNSNV